MKNKQRAIVLITTLLLLFLMSLLTLVMLQQGLLCIKSAGNFKQSNLVDYADYETQK